MKRILKYVFDETCAVPFFFAGTGRLLTVKRFYALNS